MARYTFDAWLLPEVKPYPPRLKGVERFVYVGCVHVATPDLLKRLEALLYNPPDYLIFGGDVTGSAKLESLKRDFYECVYNRAREDLQLDKVEREDDEILNYVGERVRAGYTLRQGYLDLLVHQMVLEGHSVDEIAARVGQLSDHDIADAIRAIAQSRNFGPWVKPMSRTLRENVLAGFRGNAEQLLAPLQKLMAAGVEVHIVGGNWEITKDTAETIGSDGIEVFDGIPFFREAGINFYDECGVLKTKATFHVFVPYGALRNSTVNVEFLRPNRDDGRTVIVVAHSFVNWPLHRLATEDPTAGVSQDYQITIDQLGNLLSEVRPDEVIYPHDHDLLLGSDKQPLGPNPKYVLEVCGRGVVPVTNPRLFGGEGQIGASYVPKHCLACLDVPLHGNKRPRIFGGTRELVNVYVDG